MIESDTINLLRECDAGAKMGITSIKEVLDCVKSEAFRSILQNSKRDHEELADEIEQELRRFQDEGKDPNPFVEAMASIKTNVMIGLHDDDNTIADLMTDGCNMGVKSLNRYLNQYKAADEKAKDIAKRLIHLEEGLAIDMRDFL